MNNLLTENEIELGKKSIAAALQSGAGAVRVTLNKTLMELVATLDGEVDKVSSCLDRSLTMVVFADRRYAAFSTNRLDEEALEEFARRCVETTRLLAEDSLRTLPDPSRIEKGAVTGFELGLYDPAIESLTPENRVAMALSAGLAPSGVGLRPTPPSSMVPPLLCRGRHILKGQGPLKDANDIKLVSEEGEYSDSVYDTVVMDSEGTFCRHCETSFEYGVEITVETPEGEKYSSYWWEAAPTLADFDPSECGRKAFERAAAQAYPVTKDSFTGNMVVDTEVSSRLLTPVLNALAGSAIQQKNTFLDGSLSKKVFSEGMTVMDRGRDEGKAGSRLFDSEGVSSPTAAIIREGVVQEYFLNTYFAAKTGMAPTVEDSMRPCLESWPAPGMTREDLIRKVGSGILVTGFNGGNSNSATGDFSFGIEGFIIKDGKIGEPVREMLITGNLIELWNSVIAVADDARACSSRPTPSVAFKNVSFSG